MATSIMIKRSGLKSVGLCKLWTEWKCQKCVVSHNDTSIDQLFKMLQSRSWNRMLNSCAISPSIRRGKVLSIRSQIARGTYSVDDLLTRAMDRVLEDISFRKVCEWHVT